MILIFFLAICSAQYDNSSLSDNTSKYNQNGIIITKGNHNAFFIESEKTINLTFRFDQPVIETDKWTNCAESNTNLTELSREYGNSLIEEWLTIDINHSFHENDFTVSNNKVILHKFAKEVDKTSVKLRLPNKNIINIEKEKKIYFKSCNKENNIHYIEAKSEADFNQVIIKTNKIERIKDIKWNIVNSDSIIIPKIIEEPTFTGFIFDLQHTKTIVIKVKFDGKIVNVNGEDRDSETCLSFTVENIKLISNEEIETSLTQQMDDTDFDSLFADEIILDKDVFVGSATNFGTTLFSEYGESRSVGFFFISSRYHS